MAAKKSETSKPDAASAELVADLQRLRADFENYRKNVEREKALLMAASERRTLLKFLPVLDDLERAIGHAPAELAENNWVQGVIGLAKKLEATLAGIGVTRIEATPGTKFDPNQHEAVAAGEQGELITEELRSGYLLDGEVLRPSMVNVD